MQTSDGILHTCHQGGFYEMKTIILASVIAGVLVSLIAGPAVAQTANSSSDPGGNGAGVFTAKTVDPVRPFGSINVYNVGLDPAQVSAWAKTLNPGQKQEMVGRCAVIVQNQQRYFAETADFCQTLAIAIAQSTSGSGNDSK